MHVEGNRTNGNVTRHTSYGIKGHHTHRLVHYPIRRRRDNMEHNIIIPSTQDMQTQTQEVVKPVKLFIPIGGGKGVKICRYKQKLYVNIRNYNTDNDGRLKSTKRGILLALDEWKQLKKCVKQVDQELKTLA